MRPELIGNVEDGLMFFGGIRFRHIRSEKTHKGWGMTNFLDFAFGFTYNFTEPENFKLGNISYVLLHWGPRLP